MNTIFFPGSFNPFTKGHADILVRLLSIASKVVVGIGINIDKPGASQSAEENVKSIKRFISSRGLDERVEVTVYSGLTGEEARRHNACCIARGVRNASDFDYEYMLSTLNREIFGIETILMPSDPGHSCISSTLIRDLRAHGREDIAARFEA